MEHIDHYQWDDNTFEDVFQKGDFPEELFSHEAHLRLAWIHLKKYGAAKAIEHISSQLMSYVAQLGAADKYNHTLTVAAIKAVSHFMGKSESTDFRGFIDEFPRLKHHFKELMNQHYAVDIFTSEKAKREYVEPDLLPF